MSMSRVYIWLCLNLICLSACKKNDQPDGENILPEISVHAIYMQIFNIGDGYQENELYLACDDRLKEKIQAIDTVSNFAPVRIEVPCPILNGINDSISALDSILGFTDRFPQVWYYHRYKRVDSGIVATQKMFPFPIGKKHVWWMLDYILKHSPESFETAKLGSVSFPPRHAPPDSAWLDTVKQGLF